MAQVGDGGNKHISAQVSNSFPRDLLERLMSVNQLGLKVKVEEPSEEDEAELELSLGLSMNGRFGVDPRAKKIKRTSSIAEFMNLRPNKTGEEMGIRIGMGCCSSSSSSSIGGLMRTCSLPTETEEEWRKRKELQTLRRLEARRKRSEKQRNLKAMRDSRNRGASEEREDDVVCERDAIAPTTMNFGTTSSGAGVSGGGSISGLPPPHPPPPPSSCKGSNDCEGISESECQPAQGTKSSDARSPDGDQKSPITSGTLTAEKSAQTTAGTMRSQANKLVSPENRTKDVMRNLLEDMPCVSTKGKGPNGKRIQGFLYRYRKGEEVRILCVCHGSFLTPAEFVKHAGGGDVDHPLKHIVVSPSFL